MGKPISIPPNLKTALSSGADATVEITDVRILRDQVTQLGTTKLGIGITVVHGGEEYSQMFSLDKEVITGSIGRILVAAGIEEINSKNAAEELKKLVGMKIRVANRGGKLYWYP